VLVPTRFRVPELPPRDALAHALDVRNKEKKKQKAAATAAQRRAVVARHTHAPGSVTPLMMSHMSPAAQAMAQRYVAGDAGLVSTRLWR
jgi:hypothetical protein